MLDWLAKVSTLELVIWSIFIGISIAVFMIYYVKRILGSTVRRIIENGCNREENAMTLAELGCRKNIFAAYSIKHGILKNVVTTVAAENGGKEIKCYIPEEKRIRSELRFSGKDTDVFGIIIALVVYAALAIAMTYLVPYIIELIEGLA